MSGGVGTLAWQDMVFAVGNLSFAIALVPSLRSEEKPHLATSVLTAAWLYAFAATYSTLGLPFSAAISVVLATLWAALAIQRVWRRPGR